MSNDARHPMQTSSSAEVQARLAASREAIYRYLNGEPDADDYADDDQTSTEDTHPQVDAGSESQDELSRGGMPLNRSEGSRSERRERRSPRSVTNPSGLLQTLLAAWWHDHPARSGVAVADAALAGYARKKPLQLLALAAGAGAALVLFKPWRLVSGSALLLGLLRSTNVGSIANSVAITAAQSFREQQAMQARKSAAERERQRRTRRQQ